MSLAYLAGCGGDSLGRQPVSGSVTVDETPLQKGSIRFQPLEKGIGSWAKIEGGKYSIAKKDGLPPGKYLVIINAPVPGTETSSNISQIPGEAPPPAKELIPNDWNEKSDHTIDVKSGKNEHNFDVGPVNVFVSALQKSVVD